MWTKENGKRGMSQFTGELPIWSIMAAFYASFNLGMVSAIYLMRWCLATKNVSTINMKIIQVKYSMTIHRQFNDTIELWCNLQQHKRMRLVKINWVRKIRTSQFRSFFFLLLFASIETRKRVPKFLLEQSRGLIICFHFSWWIMSYQAIQLKFNLF